MGDRATPVPLLNLLILKLSHTQLTSIDELPAMPLLQNIALNQNHIADLSALARFPELAVVEAGSQSIDIARFVGGEVLDQPVRNIDGTPVMLLARGDIGDSLFFSGCVDDECSEVKFEVGEEMSAQFRSSDGPAGVSVEFGGILDGVASAPSDVAGGGGGVG